MRGISDCLEKFGPALELLDRLTELAEGRGKDEDFESVFNLYYGHHPTRQGLDMRDLFHHLPAATKGDFPFSVDQIRARLRVLIAEERALLLEDRDLCERELAAEPVYIDPGAFMPQRPRWIEAEQRDAEIDRRIEHKLRVLVATQRHRRARDQAEGSDAGLEAEPKAARVERTRPGAPGR